MTGETWGVGVGDDHWPLRASGSGGAHEAGDDWAALSGARDRFWAELEREGRRASTEPSPPPPQAPAAS